MRIQFGVLTLAVLFTSTAASAQEGGARVSGFFGGAFGEGGTAITTGGSVGYRFTPQLGFDFDVLVMPDTHFDRDQLNRLREILNTFPGGRLVLPGTYFDTSGRTVAFLANFVTELPTASGWLIPYLAGGGGVASVSRNIPVLPLLPLPVPLVGPGLPVSVTLPPTLIAQQIGSLRRAETDLALTVGGGVDFQILHGLAVGVDLRYLHLFGTSQDLDLARLSGRVTYRF